MKYISIKAILAFYLLFSVFHQRGDTVGLTVITWHKWPESPKKEACRRCAKDAKIEDCNECAGFKPNE